MRIRFLHRQELEDAHSERKHIGRHRELHFFTHVDLWGVPSDGIGVAEADEGGFVSKLGDHLGQAEIGECEGALGTA